MAKNLTEIEKGDFEIMQQLKEKLEALKQRLETAPDSSHLSQEERDLIDYTAKFLDNYHMRFFKGFSGLMHNPPISPKVIVLVMTLVAAHQKMTSLEPHGSTVANLFAVTCLGFFLPYLAISAGKMLFPKNIPMLSFPSHHASNIASGIRHVKDAAHHPKQAVSAIFAPVQSRFQRNQYHLLTVSSDVTAPSATSDERWYVNNMDKLKNYQLAGQNIDSLLDYLTNLLDVSAQDVITYKQGREEKHKREIEGTQMLVQSFNLLPQQ